MSLSSYYIGDEDDDDGAPGPVMKKESAEIFTPAILPATSQSNEYQPEPSKEGFQVAVSRNWWWLWCGLWLWVAGATWFIWMQDNVWCKIEAKHDANTAVQFAIDHSFDRSSSDHPFDHHDTSDRSPFDDISDHSSNDA